MSWILLRPAKFSRGGDLRLGSWSSLRDTEEKEIGKRLSQSGPFLLRKNNFWEHRFEELRSEIDGDGWSRVPQANRILSELIFQAVRHISTSCDASTEESRRLRTIEWAVLADINRPWQSKEIAGLIHINTGELTLFLRKQTGLTFHGWLGFLKMREAIRRIAEGQPFARISVDLGFSSQQLFSTTFQRATGYAPRVWAEKNTGGGKTG